MSEKLYYANAYLRVFYAKVSSCTRQENGTFAVVLDKTAFFPEGGGQPGDRGRIGTAQVIDTVEVRKKVVHICTSACERDATVACEIDFDFRFLNMQQHTGEHIFSGIIHSITGYDNVGFHMGSQFVTVDFNGKISPEVLARAEKLANAAVYADKPVEVFTPSRDVLDSLTYRSKKELEGSVRLVRIDGCDICACCGTHVARTGEVGIIKAVSMINYKSGVRITLMIGSRALADYGEKNDSVRNISSLLSAKPEEITAEVEKLLARLDGAKAETAALTLELLGYKCRECGPVVFEQSLDAAAAREMCNLLAERFGTAAVFTGKDGEGYKYTVVSRTKNLRELCSSMNSALSGRGGGRPDMVSGTLEATREAIEGFIIGAIKEI